MSNNDQICNMPFTDRLKAFEIEYPAYNSKRTYRVQYWEQEGSIYNHHVLGHISSEGARAAITYDMATDSFVLDSIAPM